MGFVCRFDDKNLARFRPFLARTALLGQPFGFLLSLLLAFLAPLGRGRGSGVPIATTVRGSIHRYPRNQLAGTRSPVPYAKTWAPVGDINFNPKATNLQHDEVEPYMMNPCIFEKKVIEDTSIAGLSKKMAMDLLTKSVE